MFDTYEYIQQCNPKTETILDLTTVNTMLVGGIGQCTVWNALCAQNEASVSNMGNMSVTICYDRIFCWSKCLFTATEMVIAGFYVHGHNYKFQD